MKFHDQVVLVTGGARGLGAAITRAFANEGASLVINYFKSDEAALKLAQEVGGFACQADVMDRQQVQAMFHQAAEHYGKPVTTVINNALVDFQFNGEARLKLSRITWSEFDAQLSGTMKAALNTVQAALQGFEQIRFGRIINIGSNLVANPVVPYQDYTAAKGALLAFTRTTAAELGPKGITCNMVSGGLLKVTDASAMTPPEVFDHIQAVTPLRRVTTPEDVAGTVVFFASDAANGITGQNINVDGGLVMS